LFDCKLGLWHFTKLRYSKCSKWPHSARVAAASDSVSETDCISAAHCGWTGWVVTYTQTPVFRLCTWNVRCNVVVNNMFLFFKQRILWNCLEIFQKIPISSLIEMTVQYCRKVTFYSSQGVVRQAFIMWCGYVCSLPLSSFFEMLYTKSY